MCVRACVGVCVCVFVCVCVQGLCVCVCVCVYRVGACVFVIHKTQVRIKSILLLVSPIFLSSISFL